MFDFRIQTSFCKYKRDHGLTDVNVKYMALLNRWHKENFVHILQSIRPLTFEKIKMFDALDCTNVLLNKIFKTNFHIHKITLYCHKTDKFCSIFRYFSLEQLQQLERFDRDWVLHNWLLCSTKHSGKICNICRSCNIRQTLLFSSPAERG